MALGQPPFHKGHVCSFNSALWASILENFGVASSGTAASRDTVARPPGARTLWHGVNRAWNSESSEASQIRVTEPAQGAAGVVWAWRTGPGTALCFRGRCSWGRMVWFLASLTFCPHSTLWRSDSSPRGPAASTSHISLDTLTSNPAEPFAQTAREPFMACPASPHS